MGRLLAVIGGVVWLSAMALIAMTIRWTEQPRHVAPLPPVSSLLKELNAARTSTLKEGETWVVTKSHRRTTCWWSTSTPIASTTRGR